MILTPDQLKVRQKLITFIEDDPELLKFFTTRLSGKSTLFTILENYYRRKSTNNVTDNPYIK